VVLSRILGIIGALTVLATWAVLAEKRSTAASLIGTSRAYIFFATLALELRDVFLVSENTLGLVLARVWVTAVLAGPDLLLKQEATAE